MSVKRRVNFVNQMRVDVPQMKSIESGISNDFDELLNALVTGENNSYIIRGFDLNMTGAIGSSASGLQMLVEDSALLHGASNESGTFYVVPTGEPPQILNSVTNTRVVGAFTPGAQNYVSLEFVRQVDDTTTGQVYIWNPANKNETTKTIPLAITLDYRLVIGTTQPASNLLPITLVTTDLSNNVVDITNIKPSLFSLGRGGPSPDPTYSYPWTDGREPNPVTSSNSLIDPFKGGDLQLSQLKDWMDAVMSRFKEIFGTPYWTSANASGSLASLRQDLANTIFTGRGTVSHSETVAGQINWSNDLSAIVIGSDLKYTIAANPATTDITLADNDVAYITMVRDVDITPNLIFTNASQTVTSVGAIPWTSGLQAGDFVKVAIASAALYYEIATVDSPTQVTLVEAYAETDTGAVGTSAQYAFGIYETNPAPSTDRHIKVGQRETVPFGENVYWVLVRQDNGGSVPRVYARFIGKEIEQGETQDVNDGTPQAVLDYIGSFSESDSDPDYGQAYTPLVAEVTTYTAVAASDITSGQRFTLNSANDINQYYGWFNKDGAGGDPTPSGLIGIEIPVTTGDNQLVVAAAMQAAIDAISDFNAVDNTNGTITVTNDDAGATTNAANVDVGGAFAVTIDTEGTGDKNRFLVDGDNLTRGLKTLDKALGELSDTVNNIPWKGTVANFAALPTSGNSDGDVRLVLDTRVAYHWKADESLWLPLTGGSGLKLIGGGTVSVGLAQEDIYSVPNATPDQFFAPNSDYRMGQSFTPVSNSNLISAAINMAASGFTGSGTLKAELYNTNGSGTPTTLISTSVNTVDPTSLPAHPGSTPQLFNFNSEALTGGTQYAVIVSMEDVVFTSGSIGVYHNTSGPVAGEGRISSTNGGGAWSTSSQDVIGTITVQTTSLAISFDADMFLEKAGLPYSANTIPTSESPIVLPNNQDVAYVEPNLIAPGGNLSVVIDTLDNVPPTAVIIGRNDNGEVIVGSSSTRLKSGESMKLYDSITDQERNRIFGIKSNFFRSDNPVTWTGSELIATEEIVLEILKDDGTEQAYTINTPAATPLPNIEQTTQTVFGLAFIQNNYIAQTFTVPVGDDFDLLTAAMKMRRQGVVTGDFDAQIWGVDGGGLPDSGNVIGTSTASIDASTLPLSPAAGVDQVFNFTGITLTAGQQYALVFRSNFTGANLEIGTANADVLPSEELAFATTPGTTGSWTTDNEDAYFVITGESAAGANPALTDGQYLYVTIDRTTDTANVDWQIGAAPAESAPGTETVIFGKRVDAGGAGYLHLPFSKQVLEPGQSVRIGASGSGGNGTVLTADVKRRLSFSPYCYAKANEIALDADTKFDTVTSTAIYSPADKAIKFENIGDILLSNELLNPEFLANGIDLTEAEMMFRYVLDNIDTAATFEFSRDGGNEYQAFTPTRIGTTDTYTHKHVFNEEASFADSFDNGATDGSIILTDDAGANPLESGSFTLATTTTVKQLPLNITKNGTALGNYRLQIVKDDGGNPSTDEADILFESSSKSISSLSSGANATALDLTLTLVAGTYHVVIVTDTEYKDTYTANNADNISVEATGTDLTIVVNGRELSLLLRVTGGTAGALSQGYGVLYDNTVGATSIVGQKHINKFFFNSDENKTVFPLNFTPDPDLLVAYDPFRGQTYVAAEGVFRIEGNSIVFEGGTFATNPTTGAEDILIIFRQIEGNGFDNSDQNANKIAAIESQLLDIGEQIESVSNSMILPKIAAPFNTVANRALMPDLSMDLKPRFGKNRIMLHEIFPLEEETGPDGQQVFGIVNDQFGQVRLVGNWDSRVSSADGIYVSETSTDGTGYAEITFYGTGLNIAAFWNGTRDQRVSIDGGAETVYNPNTSAILNNRNSTVNTFINVAKGLPLGLHTVKIRNNNGSGQGYHGFEIINEEANGNITIPAGAQLFKGKKLTNGSQITTPYNSDFESGTIGTRGGNVLIYQKSDGSVAKSINSLPEDSNVELMGTDGTFDVDINGWSATGGGGTVTHSASFGGSLRYNDNNGGAYLQANYILGGLTVGTVYEVRLDLKQISANAVALLIGDSGAALDGNGFIAAGPGRWGGAGISTEPVDDFVTRFKARGTSARFQIYEGNSAANITEFFIDNFSVKETSVGALDNADHTNEEIVDKFNWREFGAFTGNDFSQIADSETDRAFTMDDGTTTLVGTDVRTDGASERFKRLRPNTTGDNLIFTFVGTGLDIDIQASVVSSTAHEVIVDGGSFGFINQDTTNPKRQKIASGLPYGTHVVQIIKRDTSSNLELLNFVTYQTKTPTAPSGAKAIASYNILADFEFSQYVNVGAPGTGLLRKGASREMIFKGASWTFQPIDGNTGVINGQRLIATTNGDSVEYSFFGTGVQKSFHATINNGVEEIAIDGLPLTAANFPGVTVQVSTFGLSYDDSTGRFSGVPNSGADKIAISGLPLGEHTITCTKISGTQMEIESFDVITPIHVSQNVGPYIQQSVSKLGSTSIADLRKFSAKDVRGTTGNKVSKASGAAIGPTFSSSTFLPVQDMHTVIECEEECFLDISFFSEVYVSNSQWVVHQLYVDGREVFFDTDGPLVQVGNSSSTAQTAAASASVLVGKGKHFIQLVQRNSAGSPTITNEGTSRALTVKSRRY